MGNPLVSVVTATWQRHDMLMMRCMPSVAAQTYPAVEHIIVSDGPDVHLREAFAGTLGQGPQRRAYAELPSHKDDWGGAARRLGCELAHGDFVAYLDDDDAYRPQHVEVLAKGLLDHPEVGFAYSYMMAHLPDGRDLRYAGPPGIMMGTPMIMHRRELLEIATWPDGLHEDTALIKAWMDAGVDFGEVGMVTVDVYPGPATTAAIEGDPHNLNWGPY